MGPSRWRVVWRVRTSGRKNGCVPKVTAEGPMWGHPMPVLGALSPFLEPFCGHLSPKIDKVSEKLTLKYPHEGPCVDRLVGILLPNNQPRLARPKRRAALTHMC